MIEHKRLTTKEKHPHGAEGVSKDKLTGKYCRGVFEATACVEKLAEYENAEEEGRLVVLPCKVGDYIWDIDFGRPCAYEVTGFSIGNLNDDYCDDEVMIFDEVITYYSNSNGSVTGNFAASEIGKSIFLTRKEAEKAFKEMEWEANG